MTAATPRDVAIIADATTAPVYVTGELPMWTASYSWHRPWSGRRRGGTLPRWRWRPAARCCKWAWLLGTCERGATLWLSNLGMAWRATVGNVHGDQVERTFARRCDAKRWCERMMAEAERPPLTAPVDGRWIVFDRLVREYAEQQRKMLLSQSLLTMAKRDLVRTTELFGVDHDGPDGPAENGREE